MTPPDHTAPAELEREPPLRSPAPAEAMADQLRLPSGPLAPVTAVLLNHRNRHLIERSIDALGVEPGSRVLDVGFGGAASLGLLLRRAAHVCGIDPSPEMVRRARHLLGDDVAAGRLAVEVAAVDRIPFAAGHVDRVLTVQTVYFWADTRAGLAEVRRVLAPGGTFVVAMMPRAAQEHHGFRELGYNVYGAGDLGALLEEAGFLDVAGDGAGGPDDPVVLVARRP
ncbi:MAG: class I SAM-dependent methyltransferase [Actinomycetota bacterium]